jgi:hypothetical protein
MGIGYLEGSGDGWNAITGDAAGRREGSADATMIGGGGVRIGRYDGRAERVGRAVRVAVGVRVSSPARRAVRVAVTVRVAGGQNAPVFGWQEGRAVNVDV